MKATLELRESEKKEDVEPLESTSSAFLSFFLRVLSFLLLLFFALLAYPFVQLAFAGFQIPFTEKIVKKTAPSAKNDRESALFLIRN